MNPAASSHERNSAAAGISTRPSRLPLPGSTSRRFPPSKIVRNLVVTQAVVFVLALALTGCASTDVDFRKGMALSFPGDAASLDTFRVLTWNVEHFVDANDSPYIENEWDNQQRGMSEERIALFVEAIRKIDADVVAIEEIESSAVLEELAESRFPEMRYSHFAAAEELTWHQNVVVMSRYPLGVVHSFGDVYMPIENATDTEGRPASQNLTNHRLIAVQVFVDADYDFLLVAMHLKAGGGDRNQGWRLGQIDFVRGWLEGYFRLRRDANVLFAGDFNATPDKPEYARLVGADGPRALRLVDPFDGENIATSPSRDPRRRIDYLLPNSHMASEIVGGSMKVADPLDPEKMRAISDHLPVVAEFSAEDR